MVNTVRRSPFGEWNIVYFDATKTSRAKILERLRKNKCPRAQLIEAAPKAAHGVSATPMNPIATAGDTVQIHVESKVASESVSIIPPTGWKLLPATPIPSKSGPSKNGSPTARLYPIQSPPSAKDGKYEIQLRVEKPDSEIRTVALTVELVQQVR